MRKRRSTVYVRPGKDVTLYIPAETPPDVIDYLNRLKAEGSFSQGVIEMLTAYVRQRQGTAADSGVAAIPDNMPEFITPVEPNMEDNCLETASEQREEEDPVYPVPQNKLNLAQIFSLSKKNSGKLLERGETE